MKACFALPERERLFAELAERSPYRVAFDFFGSPVEACATSGALLARLRRVYGHFIVARAGAGARRMILIDPQSSAELGLARRFGRAQSAFDGHVLLADWFGWGLRIAGDSLLHYYASKLLRLWVAERCDPEMVTLHAASLAGPSGGGVVLIGEAAAGKTTLTLRLLERGFRYLSDDTTCIRRRDLACVPFPMAFVLRGGPRRAPDIALLDEPRWLVERWDAVGAAFAATALYFLGAHHGLGPGELRPIAPADTALRVLRNFVMPLGADAGAFTASPRNFDFACRLALAADGVEVESGDLAAALETILADYRLRNVASEGVA